MRTLFWSRMKWATGIAAALLIMAGAPFLLRGVKAEDSSKATEAHPVALQSVRAEDKVKALEVRPLNELPLIDRSSLKPFGSDPARQIPGVKVLLLDPEKKIILVDGEFCLDRGALEYAVVCKGENAKVHEALVVLDCNPLDLCHAMLACNFAYAGEFRTGDQVRLPKGAGVRLFIEFERANRAPGRGPSKRVCEPLENLISNHKTGNTMRPAPWAFTGSRLERGADGKNVLLASFEKSIAALVFDPHALLNITLDSAAAANINPGKEVFYEVNPESAPSHGTQCTVVLTPWNGTALTPEETRDGGGNSEAGLRGIDAKSGAAPEKELRNLKEDF